LQLVGISFLLLAVYVLVDSARTLVDAEQPDRSFLGIGLAILSLGVMPWLARQKRRTAAELHSGALHADSRQTSICAYLSAILLGRTGLERGNGMVVGRSNRSPHHGATDRQGRH